MNFWVNEEDGRLGVFGYLTAIILDLSSFMLKKNWARKGGIVDNLTYIDMM